MSTIFLSYRREDSSDASGRLYDHLRGQFKKAYIFKDVDSIPIGANFRTYIQEKIKSSDVMLVVIGNSWTSALNSKGGRRLDDPDDFVRVEIETAIDNRIPIIPILIGQAGMPAKETLPVSLQQMIDINAIPIRRDPDFKNDFERLVPVFTKDKYLKPDLQLAEI